MRILVSAFLAIHGVIHVFGFLRWAGLAGAHQATPGTLWPISNASGWIFGLLCLAAMVLLATAAELRLGRAESWWFLALAGIVLSQGIIFFVWDDAKFGTIVNLILFVPIVVAAAQMRFNHRVDKEIQQLLATASSPKGTTVRDEELRPLPPPVRRWLEASGVIGRGRARTVRLKQRGELRTDPKGAWMPAKAEQYFTIEQPAFVWRVETRIMGLLPIVGRDKYASGGGHMLIKAASLVKIVDAGDEKIAHGAMLRFLGEMVWFPSAALSSYIEWEPIDATSAKATMRHAELTATAVFRFDGQGRVVGLSAERFLGGGAEATLTPWSVTCSEWRTLGGIQVPVRGTVAWALPTGTFTYYRWEILDVEYDSLAVYGKWVPDVSSQRLPTVMPRLREEGPR